MDPQPTSGPAPADDPAQLPGPVGDRFRARETRSAQEGGDGDGRAASAKSGDQTTTPASPAGQPADDEVVAKLTPEQRARVLKDADPDEYARVNDRFDGFVGKRLQVERAEAEKAQRQQQLLGLRDKALREKDPDAALAYTEATTSAEMESQHQSAWSEAVGVFHKLDAHPATKPIVAGLAGRDYGQLAGGNGTLAALLYKADLAQNVVDHLPAWEEEIRAEALKDAEKKLRPALEREIRARLLGEEPPPDAGTGGSSSPELPATLSAFRAYVQKMSPAEYARREAEIDGHLRTLTRRPARAR